MSEPINAVALVRDDKKLICSVNPEALALRDEALDEASMIGRVSKPEENSAAVAAQAKLHKLKKDTEDARKATKEPVITIGRKIDEAAKEFVNPIDKELLRLGGLVGDYQALELAKQRAAENARQLELQRLESERQQKLRDEIAKQEVERKRLDDEQRAAFEKAAKAKTAKEIAEADALQKEIGKQQKLAEAKSHEALDAVNAHYSDQAAQTSADLTPAAPVRADGQRVREDWEVTVIGLGHELAKYHPQCVKIEALVSEIKVLLNSGIEVRGVTARKIVKASVRSGRTPAAIEA